MERHIKVVDLRGKPLEPTYTKRARQLVKNNRAEWLTEDTIRFKQRIREEVLMKSYEKGIEYDDGESINCNNGEKIKYASHEKSLIDDKELLFLAKRRMEIKKGLIGQVIDFFLIAISCMMLVEYSYYGDKVAWSFVLLSFFGIRLIIRLIKFSRPSMKNGITNYLKERRERNLEIEYNRLKKMHR